MPLSPARRPSLAAALLLLAIAPGLAGAQYFGRNKVQYDRFDFRILPTPHFLLHFYPAESLATADAARMAERWYARHQRLLPFPFEESPLIFYADAPDFQQSNVIEGSISQGTGGVTEGLRERVIMPFTGSYAETDHVLGHELVHVFQYKIASASKGGLRTIGNVPLWFIEGMAEYLSLGREDANTAMWLRDAVRRDDLPTIEQLGRDPRYFPYRYGQALLAYIGGTWGDARIRALYQAALERGLAAGIEATLGMDAETLGARWHASIREAYAPGMARRTPPGDVGDPVALAGRRGEQNISPAVSPDGRYVAYFSGRGLFGIDLYLAEVASGRIIRQLTSVTTDAHFDALSFIGSAGSWSPDGGKLAFVVYADGDQELDILDLASRHVERRLRVPGVGAMSDPAWSPDGRTIAFTGQQGGISDLWLYDLGTDRAHRLTDDREAQLHPAWSPDGRTLAYVTDAGSETDFQALTFGPMRLALLDVAERRVRLLPRVGPGKQVSPQFSRDGRSLFFVADPDGVSDVYRIDLASAAVTRVTTLATGVSGITALSPALSVARSADVMLFSVFDDQGFGIRRLPASYNPAAGTVASTDRRLAILPPLAGARDLVEQSLAAPSAGLPPRIAASTRPMRSSLQLDYIGGPQVGVTAGGGYGTGLSGGIGLGFSDQLGNRLLQGVVQAQGDVRDIGGQLLYLNRERRWNWGGQAYHIPLAGGFSTYANTTFPIDGQDVPGTILTREIQRTFYDNAQVISQYPLSTTRRLEFTAGIQRIGFSRQVDSLYLVGNSVVRQARLGLEAPSALTFGVATAAFVGDYSFFGFTSPIAGGRYRFELAPNVGSLTYTTALADYRRYLFARPFTLAMRGLHFGRYGGGAESQRMQPLFVGQPYLVRGYAPSSFTVDECDADGGSDAACPQFDRLSGSRIAVANLELRVPLIGSEELGLISWGFLPTEVAPFVDAGVAWSRGDPVALRFDRDTRDRVPVVSAGVAVRANLLGFAIGEFYWARPFQRPGKGWVFGFQLQPGW